MFRILFIFVLVMFTLPSIVLLYVLLQHMGIAALFILIAFIFGYQMKR